MAYPHGYVKRNFFTGQFDREFSGQENAISAAGMVYCKNLLTSPQGECKTRPGTEFLGNVDSEAVIIPYRRDNRDLALVFTDSRLDVKTFDGDGNLVDFIPSTTSLVTWTNTANNDPAATAVSITGQISGDTNLAYRFWSWNNYDLTNGYTTNRLYVPGNQAYPTTYFNMRFTSRKALNRVGMELMYADGNWSASYQQGVHNWINNALLQYSDDNVNWTTVALVKPVYWGTKRESTPGGTIPIPVLWFDLLNTAQHEYWRVAIVWNRQQMLNNAPFLAHFATTVYEETTTAVQPFATPFTLDLLKKLKYSQMYGDLLICDGTHYPQRFSMTGNVPSFAQAAYAFMETDGKPSCVRYFQNRLYFGGFDAYPTRVRASRFGNYSDFQVETQGATVASPINVECNQFNERITDLWGGFTVLYAQSPDGIAFVTGMSSTPDFTLRCSERASGITPTMKDNIMYYVGFDRRKIHAFSYDFNIQQFVAPDVSRYWQEVLKSRVSEIHYVDSRSKCIVGSLEDGTGFFMFHEGGDVGYFPFDINGFISDMSVIKDGDDIHLLLVVQRHGTWMIERLHMPEFMRATNAFEQTGWERNLATQENLIKSPFFDSWRVLKNEHKELWNYNAESKIISPATTSGNPVNLAPYIGKTIRCYYGDGIRDYTECRIDRVFTEQRTEEREIEVTESVYYYGWQNTTAVTVSAIAGYSPAWNGTFTRDASKDTGGYKGFVQGSYVGYAAGYNPAVGDQLYSHGGRGYYAKATITAVNQTGFWTKSLTPSAGDPVYDSNYNQIGTITSVSGDGVIFNGATYYNKQSLTRYRMETHTEIIEVVVEAGQYAVDCPLTEDTVFNRLLLPIENISSAEPVIQIQDNGVYKGQFTGIEIPPQLFKWDHGALSVYTDSLTPDIGANVYSVAGIKIGVTDDAGINTIGFNGETYNLDTQIIDTGVEVALYAWTGVTVIYVDVSGGNPTGQFLLRREYALDRPGTAAPYAWRGRGIASNVTRYTATATPVVGSTVYNTDNTTAIGSVQTIAQTLTYYTREDTGAANLTVYNANGEDTTYKTTSGGNGYIVLFDDYYQLFRNSSADTTTTIKTQSETPVTVATTGWSVVLDEPVYDIQYGVPYRKIGVIEDNRSYLRQKGWGAIAFNIIDTMALKVGIKLDKLTNVVKWDGKQFFDSNVIMKNGTLICNIKDVPQYEKQLIFMTDDGLPFTVLAIETAGEISDRGAN